MSTLAIALIARRKDNLDALVAQLEAEGIQLAGFAAELNPTTER